MSKSRHRRAYRKCVRVAGVPAATTLLLMKDQCPAMFHPSLHNKRLKQGIIRDEKLKVSPEGLGVAVFTVGRVDVQAKLSEAKGTTRQKRGTGRTSIAAEPLLGATSSGRVISPRRAHTASVSVVPPLPVSGLAAPPFSATASEPLFSTASEPLLFPTALRIDAPLAPDSALAYSRDWGIVETCRGSTTFNS
ncbi:hypothetical protein B0H14DRAFT_2593123 [Mycena olivaceomarginata]|nr:hypothetical protein B0H14DRAFT_2593123 [Mycena olivaceomarginata]